MTKAFGDAVRLAKDAGFDAVEVHAGHGYLISQFLSPFTNRRKDAYGGPLERQLRFLREAMREVRRAAKDELAIVVKTNLRDGFEGGNELDAGVAIAKALEEEGADALVLTGGFVSKAPMFIMRGPMPMKEMSHRMRPWWLRTFVGAFGEWLVPEVPYADTCFLDDTLELRREVKLPLVYVGGVTSLGAAQKVLDSGFEAIALARALIREPSFVSRVLEEERQAAGSPGLCDHCNVCAARISTTSMACHHWPGMSQPTAPA